MPVSTGWCRLPSGWSIGCRRIPSCNRWVSNAIPAVKTQASRRHRRDGLGGEVLPPGTDYGAFAGTGAVRYASDPQSGNIRHGVSARHLGRIRSTGIFAGEVGPGVFHHQEFPKKSMSISSLSAIRFPHDWKLD